MATNNVILHLETEIHRLRENFGNLEKDLDQALEEKYTSSQENHYLRQELHMSRAMNDQMLKENRTLSQEKALMGDKIKVLERRVCDNDCVPCVIANICENAYKGVEFCCRQLEKIIILSPGPTIEGEDLKCAHLMKILEGRKIVEKYAEYKFDRCDDIVKAWNELMTMDADYGVVIIGIVKSGANSVGHVELCYLDTRTMDPRAADGRVLKIHDPQRETCAKGRVVDLQGFIEHVKDDGGVGVIFYVVNCVELNNIITKNTPNLHVKTSNTTLATEEVWQSVN